MNWNFEKQIAKAYFKHFTIAETDLVVFSLKMWMLLIIFC